jgi:hypothetical protein
MAGTPKVNYNKKIVCLATSRKLGGQCIAGKEVLASGPGRWIRPVSNRSGAEIALSEREYEDGSEPKLLDVIDIPMLAPAPHLHQTENHLIDARFYWTKISVVPWNDVAGLVDATKTLWTNVDSSKGGSNDRVSETTVAALKTSLFLIKPADVKIEVHTPGAYFNDPKRKIRAHFNYNGVYYNLGMTDPDVAKSFFARENGIYEISQEVYFCISLAETPYEGNYYKLVAAIIAKKPL